MFSEEEAPLLNMPPPASVALFEIKEQFEKIGAEDTPPIIAPPPESALFEIKEQSEMIGEELSPIPAPPPVADVFEIKAHFET